MQNKKGDKKESFPISKTVTFETHNEHESANLQTF